MSTHSHQITKDLYLVQQGLSTNPAPARPVELPTNHFICVDCSGSMSYDLPKIREQLKRKLPKLLGEKDTISIIWFSGHGQFGTLLEAEPVSTLTDLKAVEHAIDRWLKPIGLTGFTEPLEEAYKVVQRVALKNAGSVNSLMFLSDGHDNCGSRATILKAMEAAAQVFQSTTIVEYGYYADRNLLAAMAEKAGGAHIFAEDFDRYAPAFESVIQKRPTGAPRVEVTINGDPVGGFVFALQAGDLITYAIEAGKVRVPKDLQQLFFVSPARVGEASKPLAELAKAVSEGRLMHQALPMVSAAYAAVSLFATRMKSNIVYPLLKSLGDVTLIEQFSVCFGKQRYSEFQEVSKKAAFGEGRFSAGYDPSKVPQDDAFTILELLNLLASDENNRVLLDSPHFKYSRIGRGRIDSSDKFTDEEQAELAKLIEELQEVSTTQRTSSKKLTRIQEINTRIAAIHSSKPEALKFTADEAPNGYPISSLVFNEDRPNVSFMVRKTGSVDLTARLSKAPEEGEVPAVLQTHVFRNYAVIKDGLVNVDVLPVYVSGATWKKLGALLPEGAVKAVAGGIEDSVMVILNLRAIPVINRNMIKDVSARQFFELQYQLLVAQAEQKVYNSYAKELAPKERSQGLKELYGEEGAAWLKDQGVTDGGFSPKGTLAEATDFYMGKELKVSIKGYSKLPSLKEAQAAIAKNKMNGPTALMAPTIKEVEGLITAAAGKTTAVQVWLDVQASTAKTKVRNLIYKIAQTTFGIVVGQIWFQEFYSLEENSLAIEPTPGTKIECKAELTEIQIKI